MNIFKKTQRRAQMKQATLDLVVGYLRDGVDDYDTNVDAASEMLWESFGVKPAITDNMAKQIVSEIWNDAIAQTQHESADAAEFDREYEEARMGAY